MSVEIIYLNYDPPAGGSNVFQATSVRKLVTCDLSEVVNIFMAFSYIHVMPLASAINLYLNTLA